MKYLTLIMFSIVISFGGAFGCDRNHTATIFDANTNQESNDINKKKGNKMKIKIGSNNFDATLYDNETADAFRKLLPLTIKMDELNGNEKKYDFSNNLPTDSSTPKTINNGDLMIWGSKTLVLFYKTFPTQYSYTKIGRIGNSSGLENAVGTGNVTVTFELE